MIKYEEKSSTILLLCVGSCWRVGGRVAPNGPTPRVPADAEGPSAALRETGRLPDSWPIAPEV